MYLNIAGYIFGVLIVINLLSNFTKSLAEFYHSFFGETIVGKYYEILLDVMDDGGDLDNSEIIYGILGGILTLILTSMAAAAFSLIWPATIIILILFLIIKYRLKKRKIKN